MHVTLEDVARHAGVSAKTVSRVVNNQSEISEGTRARVQAAIAELGYRPNILARSLANRRSNTIAVIASNIDYFGPSRAIVGIEQQADEFGYTLLLSLLSHPEEANVKQILDEVVARRVDGIIYAVPEIGDNRRWVTPKQLGQLPPIVFLSMAVQSDLPIVAVDNRAGAKSVVQHLIEQGRRQVGIITGPLTWWEARERLEGWKAALAEADLPADNALMVEGDWSSVSGERGMEALLARLPALDALFACNDQMALGALSTLHRAGVQVPHAIALVGFDDIPEATSFFPPLTTVHQPMIEVGRTAVQTLYARIKVGNQWQPEQTPLLMCLAPTLVLRASSTLS